MARSRRRQSRTSPLVTGCAVVLVLAAACSGCGGLFYGGVVLWVRTTDVYRGAVDIALADEQVRSALGEPISEGWGLQGSTAGGDGQRTASFTVPLEGPRDGGTLAVEAAQVGDAWQYTGLAVVTDLDGRHIDLRAAAGGVEAILEPGEAAIHEGRRRLEEGDLGGAIAAFGEAMAAAPSSADARYLRGEAYRARGDLDEARADLLAARDMDARRPDIHQALGQVYLDSGDPEAGIGAFTRALELDEDRAEAWYGRARCYQSLGDTRRARAGAQQACELDYEAGCRLSAELR